MAGREIIYAPEGETVFANVDLDVYSTARLEPLVAAFGKRVTVLYVGGEGSQHEAHLELATFARTADTAIRGLVKLVERLPKSARRIWDRAQARNFNVGIEAGVEPHSREFLVSEAATQAVARVRGAIVITVYAAQIPKTSAKRRY